MVNEKKINLLKEKAILSSNLTIDLIKSSMTMSYGIGINLLITITFVDLVVGLIHNMLNEIQYFNSKLYR